jgi:hypothetical protein
MAEPPFAFDPDEVDRILALADVRFPPGHPFTRERVERNYFGMD